MKRELTGARVSALIDEAYDRHLASRQVGRVYDGRNRADHPTRATAAPFGEQEIAEWRIDRRAWAAAANPASGCRR